jgi:hypothetical protein
LQDLRNDLAEFLGDRAFSGSGVVPDWLYRLVTDFMKAVALQKFAVLFP